MSYIKKKTSNKFSILFLLFSVFSYYYNQNNLINAKSNLISQICTKCFLSFMFELWARDITTQGNNSGKYMNEPQQGDKSTVIMMKSVKNLRELR